MVSTKYATAAALCMQSESPVMLLNAVVPGAVVPTATWQMTQVAPKTHTTGVFAAAANTGLKSIHVDADAHPRSRQAKQAAPPRGRLR
jgi:hypothetical protein